MGWYARDLFMHSFVVWQRNPCFCLGLCSWVAWGPAGHRHHGPPQQQHRVGRSTQRQAHAADNRYKHQTSACSLAMVLSSTSSLWRRRSMACEECPSGDMRNDETAMRLR